jgi:hypothetical protein
LHTYQGAPAERFVAAGFTKEARNLCPIDSLLRRK